MSDCRYGVSPVNYPDPDPESSRRKKMVCANLREISRSFLRESSSLRIFVLGVNAKERAFFLG